LEKDVPGFFEIKKLPRGVKERLQDLQDDEDGDDSEFVEESVS